jgi:tetratricopeptide (TPR) repeat protein
MGRLSGRCLRKYAASYGHEMRLNKRLVILLFYLALSAIPCKAAIAAKPFLRRNVVKDGEIVSVQGDGWVQLTGVENWTDAAIRQVLTAGDRVRTGNYGKISILFIDHTQIKVHRNSLLFIKAVSKVPGKKGTVLRLDMGEIWSRARTNPGGLMIETPSATAAIRGTDWDIAVDEKGTTSLTVLKGLVEFFNDYGKVMVGRGEQAVAAVGKAPVRTFLVKPRERVQWVESWPVDIPGIIRFYSYRRDDVLRILPSVKKAVEKDPSDMKSRLMLAGLYHDLGEKDRSLKLFDNVLKADPENGRALAFRGLLALDNLKTGQAESYLEKALENLKGSGRTDALCGMAGVYISENELARAEKILAALRQKYDSPAVGLSLANFQAFQGDFTEALGTCSEYSAKYRADARFDVLTASLYLALDMDAKARGAVDKAISINPRSSEAYTVLGKYYYIEGRWKEADGAYRKAVALDDRNAEARSGLGVVQMEKGYYGEARNSLTQAIEIAPYRPDYLAKRGLLYNWMEDIKQAERDYRKASVIDPADYQSLDGLGFVALKEGRTKEAINYFLKASLLSPQFAEPHIFLAIADYQRGDIIQAFAELKLAELLDPKDPVPHIIEYIIYEDTYRPFESVAEAKKALDLLPYLKSLNPIETTQQGLTNLGSALLGLGMTEWASSFAEDSYNPYDAASYFFIANRFGDNELAFNSAMNQGFILDPMSINYSPRYQDIVRRPQNNATVRVTTGDDGGGFSREEEAKLTGYSRKPWETSYFLSADDSDDKGFRPNGYRRSQEVQFALGGKPDYKNGFFFWGLSQSDRNGDPGIITSPDIDDHYKDSTYFAAFGYNHRFGPKNYLLAQVAYAQENTDFYNPDSFGADISPVQASFINKFGLGPARNLFEQDVYDITLFSQSTTPIFATDSSGLLAEVLTPLPLIPAYVDLNPERLSDGHTNTLHFQLRHMFDIADGHELTYGVEYVSSLFKTSSVFTDQPGEGLIDFYDDFFLLPPDDPLNTTIPFLSAATRVDSTDTVSYLDDRWRASESLLIEAGLFYETYTSEESFKSNDFTTDTDKDHYGIDPRAGFSLKLGSRHILRAAFQKRLMSDAVTTLAPVDTSGLVFEPVVPSPGTRLTDAQVQLESRWTGRIFTQVSIERRSLHGPDEGSSDVSTMNRANIFSAAINAILSERSGFLARYKYDDDKYTNGLNNGKAYPLVPEHALTGGIVWVSPLYVKAELSTTYAAHQFADDNNSYKMPDYWTTDFTARWEPFKKHVFVSLEVDNIFNKYYETKQGYPAAGRSGFLTLEYRF